MKNVICHSLEKKTQITAKPSTVVRDQNNSVAAENASIAAPKQKLVPRAPRKKLVYAAQASENYRVSLEKKKKT